MSHIKPEAVIKPDTYTQNSCNHKRYVKEEELTVTMDMRKVKKLIELIQSTGVAEIEIREGEESVRITREVRHAAPMMMAQPAMQAPQPAAAPTPAAPEPAAPAKTAAHENKHVLKSPPWSARFIYPQHLGPNLL